MKKFDFSIMSDNELLMVEHDVDIKLEKALRELIYNTELEDMYEDLEEIKVEKKRRKLDV